MLGHHTICSCLALPIVRCLRGERDHHDFLHPDVMSSVSPLSLGILMPPMSIIPTATRQCSFGLDPQFCGRPKFREWLPLIPLKPDSSLTREAIWIQGLTDALFRDLKCELRGDNQGALAPTVNPVYHQRIKHIDIRHRFVWSKMAWCL